MMELDFVQKVEARLRANAELNGYVASPPEARLIPFQQSATEKYVAVANLLSVNQICLRVLTSVTNLVVQNVLGVETPDFPKAIEVLFFATDGEFTDRVLCVSVYEFAFSHQFLMPPSVLANQAIIPSVTCAWYWDCSLVPMEPNLA